MIFPPPRDRAVVVTKPLAPTVRLASVDSISRLTKKHPMRHLFAVILRCTWIAILACAISSPHARAESPAPTAAAAPLPVAFFKNLHSGKKQTVVVYGTSLSASSEWPKALDAYLREQFPGQVTFVNAASNGKQSNWGVEQLEARVLSQKPDLVFLEFSMNDAATKHHISPEQAQANLDKIITDLRTQNPQVDIVLQTMNAVFDGNDGKQAATARPDLETYYEGYRRYAHAHSLPLIDHFQTWSKLQREDRAKYTQWMPDGTHPIPEASLAVTWAAIRSLLEKSRSAATSSTP